MQKPQTSSRAPLIARSLRQHFFRRFFDNDTLSLEGETQTTIVRALAFVAVPTLMFAFWLLPSYPGRRIPGITFVGRDLWAVASDRYFFVLYSFVAMGTVATVEWEMLFPDRADFLILLPLGLKTRELFYAKAKALLSFLGMFLVAANIFSLILFPAVSTKAGDNFWRTVYAHFLAVMLSGIFSALSMLAIEGLLICVAPARWQRPISTAMQALSITILLLLLLLYPLIGGHLKTLLAGHAAIANFIPPLWFLGLYQQLMEGSSAPGGASTLATLGIESTALVMLLSLITYPLAWSRQKRHALEGAARSARPTGTTLTSWLHRWLLTRPQGRAVFHFISLTVRRNARYQIYLALYGGVGVALALASVVTLRVTAQHTLVVGLSLPGLHAVLPLLLFWMAVGLRVAFGFPVDMRARWVFPMNLLRGNQHGRATYAWVLFCFGSLSACVLGLLAATGWRGSPLILQAIWAAALAVLLADVFFIQAGRIPFTQPRLPGRATLPMTLVLYAAAFPVFVLLTVYLEMQSEAHWTIVLRVVAAIAALHFLLAWISRLSRPNHESESRGFILDEPEDEFQTLGLTA